MMEGQCACGKIQYRLKQKPMFVHACHCTWCQRETGGPHAINAMIETSEVELLEGELEEVMTPSASGSGQIICRCPECRVAVWSHYSGMWHKIAFVRVGSLKDPSSCPPDLHIFTSTMVDWYVLPEGARSVPEFYRRSEYWPPEMIERRAAALAD